MTAPHPPSIKMCAAREALQRACDFAMSHDRYVEIVYTKDDREARLLLSCTVDVSVSFSCGQEQWDEAIVGQWDKCELLPFELPGFAINECPDYRLYPAMAAWKPNNAIALDALSRGNHGWTISSIGYVAPDQLDSDPVLVWKRDASSLNMPS